jgi:hypothetical protein
MLWGIGPPGGQTDVQGQSVIATWDWDWGDNNGHHPARRDRIEAAKGAHRYE